MHRQWSKLCKWLTARPFATLCKVRTLAARQKRFVCLASSWFVLVLVAGSAICRAANVLPNRKRLICLWPPMVAIWKGRSLRCSHPGHWLTANWVQSTGTSTEPARVSSRVTSLSRRSLARPSHRRRCLVIGHQFSGRMVLLLLGAVNIYTVREQWPSAFSRFGSTNKLQIAISSPAVPKQRPLGYRWCAPRYTLPPTDDCLSANLFHRDERTISETQVAARAR